MVVSEKNFTILAESYTLSPRQREIARLLLSGTIRHYELAEAMVMSHGNLAKHLLRMSNKMHCHMELAGMALISRKRYLFAVERLIKHYWRSPGELTEQQVHDYLLERHRQGPAKSTFKVMHFALRALKLTKGRWQQFWGYVMRHGCTLC